MTHKKKKKFRRFSVDTVTGRESNFYTRIKSNFARIFRSRTEEFQDPRGTTALLGVSEIKCTEFKIQILKFFMHF